MQFELSIINGKTVFDIVRAHRAECVGIVREAYLAHADGQSVNPDSYFLKFPDKPDCRIIALPAYLGNNFDVAGLKWIASYPANVQRGFPRASAVLVLNNYETGYPFAILEGSIISAARTAASAILAAHWLNGQSHRAHSLGIVGAGFIARYVYEFLVDTGWAIGGHAQVRDGHACRYHARAAIREPLPSDHLLALRVGDSRPGSRQVGVRSGGCDGPGPAPG